MQTDRSGSVSPGTASPRGGRPDVVVVGAGVCGLSTAAVLLQAGLTVTVYSAEPPHRTTSATAGALWGPHLVGRDKRVGRWADLSLRRFRELAAEPAAGIRELAGLVASAAAAPADAPPAFAPGAAVRADPSALPGGYRSGWRYSAPVLDMPVYLDYLTETVLSSGGQLVLGPPLRDLGEVRSRFAAPIVVNCAGTGARALVPDPGVEPVRGQVVIAANPGLAEFFVGEGADPDDVTYFFPHGATVVLGGTHEHGESGRHPDPAAAARILAQCAAAAPALAGAHVLAHRVGLRPVRAAVRLEAQDVAGGGCLIHNYGHGGAGVTLSWGCALEVARIVADLASR